MADKTAAIRKTEDENLKQGRKKNRDLSQFRQALERLQEQVREVEVCKRSYCQSTTSGVGSGPPLEQQADTVACAHADHETLENETETWGMIEGKVAHMLRSTLDLSDRLASKATSDPTLERLLAEHPDPFDSYRPETEEPRDMFSVLPPLMQFGLSKPGSRKGSVADHDGGGEAAGRATPTKDGDAYSRGSRNSAGARSRGKGEDSSATATPRQAARKAVSVGDVLGLNPPVPPPLDHSQSAPAPAALTHSSLNHHRPAQFTSASTAFITSPPAASTRSLSPVAPSPPDLAAAPPESPSPIRVLTTAAADPEDKWRGVASPTRSSRGRGEGGRRGLTRVSEQEPELDPYAGDWGAPQGYGVQGSMSPAMLGNAGFDSGSDDEVGAGRG